MGQTSHQYYNLLVFVAHFHCALTFSSLGAQLSDAGLQNTRKCDFTSSLRGCVKTETHSLSVALSLSLLFIRSQSYFTNYETFTQPSSHNATGSQTF